MFEYPSISFTSPLHSPSCRSNSVQAVLVDSWKSPSEHQQLLDLPEKPVIQVEKQKDAVPKIYMNHLEHAHVYDGELGREDVRANKRFMKRPECLRKTSDLSTSSDHIDRGVMSFDMLQTRINSVESSLDQIYGKVKGELRDIRDTIKTLSASRTPLWSPVPPTNNGENPKGPIFSYANLEKYEI